MRQSLQLDQSISFTCHPISWLHLSEVGLKMKFFCKWSSNFWSDGTGRSKRTTSGGHGSLWPENSIPNSIYFSTEISETFGIMESTHDFKYIIFCKMLSCKNMETLHMSWINPKISLPSHKNRVNIHVSQKIEKYI